MQAATAFKVCVEAKGAICYPPFKAQCTAKDPGAGHVVTSTSAAWPEHGSWHRYSLGSVSARCEKDNMAYM